MQLESELKDIGVLDWFNRYENGLDQEVGERGSNVSAGERQFIALLRAVLAKREIIVFDEATANLDIESENSILDATDRLLDYQTSVVIAHRLETILNAEKIIVMKDGELVGFDNHDNLLQENEIYKDLFSAWNLSSQ
jgi:ABC-type multidrug transport system fused ATPase/permease subunit